MAKLDGNTPMEPVAAEVQGQQADTGDQVFRQLPGERVVAQVNFMQTREAADAFRDATIESSSFVGT